MPASDQRIQSDRYHLIPRVLIFITCERHVLLLKGAPTKRIWANMYNGIGGHVERDEDIFTSVAREIREETGLAVDHITLRGVVNVDAGDTVGVLVFVFSAEYVSGEPVPSEEGTLEWVRRDRLPSLPLVEDLPALIPRILDTAPDAAPFFARTSYNSEDKLVIRFSDPG